jgi:hypothetical protein
MRSCERHRLWWTPCVKFRPEVCFCYWNGRRSLDHPKKSGFGFMERFAMVENVFGSAPRDVRASVPRKQATDDDILGAFAALWTAQRIHEGRWRPSSCGKRNGAFFRLVKCTTCRPPWQAATGGTRHGQEYQASCASG